MIIKDKVVIVTGSSSGIGRATAIRFAKEGAKVVVNYRENKSGGEESLAEVTELVGADACTLVQADLTKPADVRRLFKTAVERFSTIDIVVNNAASGSDPVPFIDATPDDLRAMLDGNLLSVLLCSQEALRIMQKQGHGKILNTSSIRGWEAGGRSPVYAASKAAVNSLTKSLAKLAAPNVHVNAVAPGFVKTRAYDKLSAETIDRFMSQTYLKRWVTEEEIVDAFVFLAENDAMTGQVIYVDAGFTLK